jgi:3-methyl-2-oxobutanoate hydroxymethyltransferase
MSLTTMRSTPSTANISGVQAKVTIPSLLEKKHLRRPITAITAYDYASARIIDEAGLDIVLVGDSLAMVMQGHENTLAVTMDEMLLYTRGVRRAVKRALLIADMPFGSYHNKDEATTNALRFLKQAGAEAVKLEGGRSRTTIIRHLVDAEIPVMGHLGLTPQSVHRMGGYKVQGKTLEAIDQLRTDAAALCDAGCFSIVLEGVPRELAEIVTKEVPVPVIGIGAGPDCDGQILVLHDLLSLTFAEPAKFVRRYADVAGLMHSALEQYRSDVESRSFPSDAESYHLSRETRAIMGLDE